MLINGGAAVALAAFLQAVIDKKPAIIPWILTGIAFNVVGVACAAALFVAQYNQGMYERKHGKYLWKNPWWKLRWSLVLASLTCFIAGLMLVVVGGFQRL
jgi:hypothetical protein